MTFPIVRFSVKIGGSKLVRIVARSDFDDNITFFSVENGKEVPWTGSTKELMDCYNAVSQNSEPNTTAFFITDPIN